MIITRTPLRVSFLGGNTDFREYYLNHGGLVVTTAIDKYIYCIVKERFDDLVIVNYMIKEIVNDVEYLKHDLVREAMKLVGVTKGIEITFLSDIPAEGSGLGSSSAVTVGVLNALHNYIGESVSAKQLAEEAIKIEIDILKKPIGVQDQYIAAFGGLKQIEFLKGGGAITSNLPINSSVREDFNNSLMLLYTGVTRKAEDVLSSLRIADHKQLLDLNKALAKEGVNCLLTGNLKLFGRLLDKYWKTKKQLSYKISSDKIDAMYQSARERGVIGGKVIGAGGGGFMLVMFPANKRASVRKALIKYRELPFRLESSGSKVLLNI